MVNFIYSFLWALACNAKASNQLIKLININMVDGNSSCVVNRSNLPTCSCSECLLNSVRLRYVKLPSTRLYTHTPTHPINAIFRESRLTICMHIDRGEGGTPLSSIQAICWSSALAATLFYFDLCDTASIAFTNIVLLCCWWEQPNRSTQPTIKLMTFCWASSVLAMRILASAWHQSRHCRMSTSLFNNRSVRGTSEMSSSQSA